MGKEAIMLDDNENEVWNKVNNSIKKNLAAKSSVLKFFWKLKQNLTVMKLQILMIKNA